jgi:parallel beta-helix repeat protein
VQLVDACGDNRVERCTMRDLAAGGVKIAPGCERNTVADCRISHGARVYLGADAVLIGDAGGNQVVHNEIDHFYHVGVSAGWVWGYGPSKAFGNVIEYNHIHDIGQGVLSDLAGIYTLGPSPGTRIRFNRIHDIRRRGYGAFGIYLDEATSSVLVENNLVYRCQSGGFQLTSGKDNVIRNNIFAHNEELWVHRVMTEPHFQADFERNVVALTGGHVLRNQEAGAWGPENTRFARNVYFDVSRHPLDFDGKSLEAWRGLGMDAGSLVADPQFVDPGHDNFRLAPGSPAFQVGFQEFDLTHVGPRDR